MNGIARNVCFVLIWIGWGVAPRAEAAESVFQRGVCYVHSWRGGGGYGSEASADTLAQLDENHVDWIQLNPFGYQRTPNDTVVRSAYERRGAETDAAMARDVARAHRLGMGVMLKPHIWISHGSWPGEIAFEKKADWDAWFDSYGAMMIHYAEFAERAGVGYLCIGTELKETSSAQPERWRALISKIRAVYEGRLVYAANWDEYARIPWWDDLDAIGVNAYFPLTKRTEPTLDQLCAGVEDFRDRIAIVQRKFRKPVIFTELGYRSEAGSAIRPWEHRESNAADFALQERCYEAIFRTFWEVEWLEGIYWWKWFSNSSARPGQYDRDPFSPRNKPAEQVMSLWYAKPRPGENFAAR